MNYLPTHFKGRGALSNPAGRFESLTSQRVMQSIARGEENAPAAEEKPGTVFKSEPVRSIITKNQSPDLPFDQSINPYRGCEHGCIYCYARPSHAYINLSAGLDFETKIFCKDDAAKALEEQLRRPGYRCSPIVLGANTDPYQPVEKERRITRSILKVLLRYRHPVTIITKGSLIARDVDILAAMAQLNLVQVMISVTTLNDEIKRTLEPRVAAHAVRFRAMKTLSAAGIPVGVMVAPIIPALTDREMEHILQAAAGNGATRAGYVLLRLPHEVKGLFREWLLAHYPLRAKHVMSLIQQSRGGHDYDARFGKRMRGEGHFADLIAHRFHLACRRFGLNQQTASELNTKAFQVPLRSGDQIGLL